MSRDIRSFFTVLSKKSGTTPQKPNKPKKPAVLSDSDDDVVENTPKKVAEKKSKKTVALIDSDEEVIESTPKKPQEKAKAKDVSHSKRRAQVLSSDSEDEAKVKSKSPAKKQKTAEKSEKDKNAKLKPITFDAINRPIQQSEVKNVPNEDKIKKDEQKKEKPKKKSKNRDKKGKQAELEAHGDKDFAKTLEELDDLDDTIFLENLDLLDKTLEEKKSSDHHNTNKNEQKSKESSVQHIEEKDICPTDKKQKRASEKGHEAKERESKEFKERDDTPQKAKKRPRQHSESTPTPKKKTKLEHLRTDSGIDPDLEKWEKKRQSAGLYVAYLHRGGPKHHGEKDYPKGKPDCLKGLTFLRTGVLDSLESDEFENLVTDHGGKIVHGISKKVNYVVVGDQPGPAKLEKARKYNIPEISEDQLLDMILNKSGMKPRYAVKYESEDLGIGGSEEGSPKSLDKSPHCEESKVYVTKEDFGENSAKSTAKVTENGHTRPDLCKLSGHSNNEGKQIKKEELKMHKMNDGHTENSKKSEANTKENVDNEPNLKILQRTEKTPDVLDKSKDEVIKKEEPKEVSNLNVDLTKIKKETLIRTDTKCSRDSSIQNLSWTDRYKPTSIKSIIGQQDPNSNMNKLTKWLENWFKNLDPERRKKLPRPTLYNQYDGAYFKAALLSGPPGVGKTTTATLVAKELGFDIVEFNASDTRSKKLLHEEISQMMKSKTVAGFATGQNSINQKRVLLMDEVDGMAGNEDRGGIAELINFIKTANFPIICMCNNRDLPKMRSLVNHCYALKFGKPNVNQVRGAMMSICFKEGLSIKPDALAQLIIGTGCDIRQTLNHLSMWSAAEKCISSDTVQKESKMSQKDVVFGAWDVIKKVFNKSENKEMSLADKSRLFFYDYSFGPMFVQENYLTVEPECTGPRENRKLEILLRRQLAADCLSRSDLIESKIRSMNNWSLLESQAFFSTVLPSHYLSGKMDQVRFPGWFGKNSQRNKSLRMIGELHSHSRTSISGDKFSVRMDYAEPLLSRLLTPLKEKQAAGIDETLDVMKSYCLLRDDLSNLCNLMSGFQNKNRNPFDSVSSAVKSALTRKYNKTMVLSFAPPTASKKKKGAAIEQDELLGEGEEDVYSDDDETEDGVDTDALIKVKNKNTSQAGTSQSSGSQKESKSKGKSSKSGDSKSSKGKAKK